jgi:hypothetical protein
MELTGTQGTSHHSLFSLIAKKQDISCYAKNSRGLDCLKRNSDKLSMYRIIHIGTK